MIWAGERKQGINKYWLYQGLLCVFAKHYMCYILFYGLYVLLLL